MDVRERTVLRTLAVVVFVAAAYFGTGRLLIGLSSAPNDLAEAVWLPSGLSVAALLLFGPSAAAGALIGSAGLELVAGYPVWRALALGIANAAAGFLCYHMIVRGGRRAIRMEHSRGVRDLLVAAVAAGALSASAGVICDVACGNLPFATAAAGWLVRFGSVSTGIVLLAPAVVYVVRRGRPVGGSLRYLELALALGMLITSAFLLQEPTISVLAQDLAVAFVVTAFFWIAFRFTPREMAFAVFAFAAAAIAGVIVRHNPVPPGLAVEANLSFQALLGGVAMIAYFLSSRVARQERSNERARLAAKIYDTTREGIMVTTPDGTITSVNDSFGRITGYTRGDTLGKGPTFMKSDRHPEDFFKGVWDTLVATGAWEGEVWDRRADGSLVPTWLSISPVRDEKGDVKEYVGLLSDISADKRGEGLQYLATHDPLTGLPNRALLEDRLVTALARSRRSGTALAVLYFDLDRFKEVNDALGHSAGDTLLVEIARRCLTVVRESDTVGRSGGDEFSVVASDFADVEDLSLLAQRLISAIGRPVMLGDVEAQVTASVGIALYPEDGADAARLTRHADDAMYRAKTRGGNRFEFFRARGQGLQ